MTSNHVARNDVSAAIDLEKQTAAKEEPNDPRRVVDLERREDRFIIYVRDTRQLLTDASTLWGVGLSLTYHF